MAVLSHPNRNLTSRRAMLGRDGGTPFPFESKMELGHSEQSEQLYVRAWQHEAPLCASVVQHVFHHGSKLEK